MNDEKGYALYVAMLYLRGYGLVDFDESRFYLNALKDFDILEKEANEDAFGEGIYEVSLMREWWSADKLVKAECIKKSIIDRGDEL